MELLQKISKKYLSLSFTTLMLTMSVVSCDCSGTTEEEKGKPSISFETDLVGSTKTTQLQVEGSTYQAGDFKIKVSVTNGSIKIGNETFTDAGEEEKPLNQILGINAEETVEGDKTAAVEVIPKNLAVPLNVTVKLIDKEGNEVKSINLKWTPALFTGLEATISDLVGDKITVVVKAKKDGNPVNVEAADLAKVEITLTKNPNDAEAASIVETLELVAGDISAGSISKQFTVKRGTKDTHLTLALLDKVSRTPLAEKSNILVQGIAAYGLEPVAKINNGVTKVKITVKGKENLEASKLAKLKLRITRTVGSNATIASQSAGSIELKDGNALSISATDAKEGTLELTVDPRGEKKVAFKLELLDDKDVLQGTERTLEWEDGIDLEVGAAHDRVANKVKVTVSNKGEAEVQDLALSYQRTAGVAALLNNVDAGQVAALTSATKVSKSSPFSVDLPIDLKGDKTTTFKFVLTHNGKTIEKSFTYSAVAPVVTITTAKPVYKGDAENQVTFIVKAGANDLTEEELKAVRLVYTSAEGGQLTDVSGDVQGKNLYVLLGNMAKLDKNTSKNLVLTIEHNSKHKVNFADIKLQGSQDEDSGKIANIAWEGELKVALGVVKHTTDANKVTVSLKNNSGFELKQAMLEKIAFKYTSSNTATLKNGSDDSTGKSLWALLGKDIAIGATESIDLAVDYGTELAVDFTNFELTGSADGTVKLAGPVGFAKELKVALGVVKHTTDANKVTVSLQNNSGFELKQAMLEKIAFKYTSSNTATLKNGSDDSTGKSLWALLGKDVAIGATESIDLAVDYGTESAVDFTNFELTGSADGTVKLAGPIKFAKELKVSFTDTNKVDLTAHTTSFKISFRNKGAHKLSPTDLANIKVQVVGSKLPTKLTYKSGSGDAVIDSGVTTLADLLGAELDTKVVSGEVEIKIDVTGGAADFNVVLQGSTSAKKSINKQITYTP